MERVPGSTLASVFDSLSVRERKGYLDQLVAVVQQLTAVEFQEIGGFALDMKVTVDPWHGKGPHAIKLCPNMLTRKCNRTWTA